VTATITRAVNNWRFMVHPSCDPSRPRQPPPHARSLPQHLTRNLVSIQTSVRLSPARASTAPAGRASRWARPPAAIIDPDWHLDLDRDLDAAHRVGRSSLRRLRCAERGHCVIDDVEHFTHGSLHAERAGIGAGIEHPHPRAVAQLIGTGNATAHDLTRDQRTHAGERRSGEQQGRQQYPGICVSFRTPVS